MKRVIAERHLLYSLKDDATRKECTVRIGKPYDLEKDMVEFNFDPGTAGCSVEILGLPHEFTEKVYGADKIQALSFATDIDPYLRGLSRKYDFYWFDGSPYFDDQ